MPRRLISSSIGTRWNRSISVAASLAMELAALPPLRLRRKTSGVAGRHAFAFALRQVTFAPVAQAIDTQGLGEALAKRTIIVRRLKGSDDSTHYLERDELAGLKGLQRHYTLNGIKSAYVFVNERGHPFGRMGIGRMIERAGETAKLPFPVHVHMLRHSTGYALAGRGMEPDACNTSLATPASPTQCVTPRCRRSLLRIFGGANDRLARVIVRLCDVFGDCYLLLRTS